MFMYRHGRSFSKRSGHARCGKKRAHRPKYTGMTLAKSFHSRREPLPDLSVVLVLLHEAVRVRVEVVEELALSLSARFAIHRRYSVAAPVAAR